MNKKFDNEGQEIVLDDEIAINDVCITRSGKAFVVKSVERPNNMYYEANINGRDYTQYGHLNIECGETDDDIIEYIQSDDLVEQPMNIRKPPEGWVYAGISPFKGKNNITYNLMTLACNINIWHRGKRRGDSIYLHYAVKIGSPEHIELYRRANAQKSANQKTKVNVDKIAEFLESEHFDRAFEEWKENNATITLGGITFPKPVDKPLKTGETYFTTNVGLTILNNIYTWKGDIADLKFLAAGIIQRTREGAISQSKATIAAYKGGAA